MKRICTLLVALAGLTACSAPSEENTASQKPEENKMNGFFIGTYTNESSEGIYYSELDTVTGQLSAPRLTGKTSNPSYLALSESGTNLYAVNENEGDGMITSFKIGENDSLEVTDSRSSEGTYPCYISLTEDGGMLLVANYGSGNVLSVELTADGTFGKTESYGHHGSGPNPERQKAPHAHTIRQVPGTAYVLAADLGADKIYQYLVKTDGMELADSLVITPGAGPRHIEFHPKLPVIYVINELSSTIEVFSWEKENNFFKKEQVISTLPEGYGGENYCADIHVHPEGKLLFGSNRGHDSIVSYQIGDDGLLRITGHFSAGVNWPRNFAVGPGGNFLVIANQRGNSVLTAAINQDTGALTETGHVIEVSQPSCIVFR